MNWDQVIIKIKEKIQLGTDVNTIVSTYRFVVEIPPYKCKQYDNKEGYKVKIGENNAIKIPISMLQTLFQNSQKNNNTYNTKVFRDAFPVQAKNHGCHVHVIGKIFEKSGSVVNVGKDYLI
jgi:predicted HTH transcriptional regulator